MAVVARHVRIAGRVQGVFFRAWTQAQARELDVSGWVRNANDGSVEAHLEGDDAAVKTLIHRLHDGPPSAAVASVKVDQVPADEMGDFRVRH